MTWSQHRPSNGLPIRRTLDEIASQNVPPKKPTLRKNNWTRIDHDMIKMDLWGLVAEMAHSSRAVVEAFITRLEVHANNNKPRGSVEGFNVAALAITWRHDRDELARIYAALEHHDIGWIDQDHIVTFWPRNPDGEDVSAPERNRRKRLRKKIRDEGDAKGLSIDEILSAMEAAGVGYPQRWGDTRNAVTVTTRPEQIRKTENPGAEKNPDLSVQPALPENEQPTGAVDNSAAEPRGESANGLPMEVPAIDDAISTEAETWLATEGLRIVIERLVVPPQRAATLIERWRRDLQDDAPAMVQTIAQAAGCANAAHFMVSVTDAVKRHLVRATNGGSLQLGPVVLGPATPKPAPAAPLSDTTADSLPDFDVNRRRASRE